MAKLRSFQVPEKFEATIVDELKNLGVDPTGFSRIAESIIRLSNHFIEAKQKSPLQEKWGQLAYLSYYLPLNYLRAQAVCQEALRLGFFDQLKSFIDIGSGMGSLTMSLCEIKQDWKAAKSIDLSKDALAIQANFLKAQPVKVQLAQQADIQPQDQFDLAALSYSWNELSPAEKAKMFQELLKFEAILIIEPSTSLHARGLMQLRQDLIEQSYYAWGPCTHQSACPLLTESKTDWCHDRIAIQKSKWFSLIEKLLPFKNETLTFSYLLMRRSPPAPPKIEGFDLTRVIGDELVEKGKTRQAICRSPVREFLAWFPQRVKHNNFGYTHGSLLQLKNLADTKSNEIRIKEEDIQILS
jgi:ribosomal protein RSM22 (predicted rRNA methylase)